MNSSDEEKVNAICIYRSETNGMTLEQPDRIEFELKIRGMEGDFGPNAKEVSGYRPTLIFD